MSFRAKPVRFRGSALDDLQTFPRSARREAGYQLDKVQNGFDLANWKPMNAVGRGVREIRIWESDGTFRVIYIAKFEAAVYVLHCFQKKTQATAKTDIDLACNPLSGVDKGVGSMSNEQFASVWDAIEDSPAEAENMKLRSTLMMALEQHIKARGWTQTEAARVLNVTQPRISDLMRGKIDLFGLDTLVNMLTAAGLRVEMQVAAQAA